MKLLLTLLLALVLCSTQSFAKDPGPKKGKSTVDEIAPKEKNKTSLPHAHSNRKGEINEDPDGGGSECICTCEDPDGGKSERSCDACEDPDGGGSARIGTCINKRGKDGKPIDADKYVPKKCRDKKLSAEERKACIKKENKKAKAAEKNKQKAKGKKGEETSKEHQSHDDAKGNAIQ